MLQLEPDLRLLHLGVVDGDVSALVHQHLRDVDGGGLPGVAGVLLEGEPEDADLLAGDGVEEALDDPAGEAGPLVVVEEDDLGPVVGHLGQVEALADVDQVEDVLLEARATKADACLQEKF